jgi:uncharacterized protein involved in exopolysaccharide biosynthesis
VLPGKKYSPEDVLEILWHRKWLLILPSVLVSFTAAVVALQLPKIYRSETLIQVVPQRIPESYVRSTVTTRIEDRLGSIQQMILSRSRLERIIQDFDLYPEDRKVWAMEDVVTRMRDRDVNVRVERGDAFRVSYVAGNPRTAQKVTERLGSLFIDENLRDREALAEQTSQFLEGQLEGAKRRLLEHEKKLESYRRLHSGELPTQLQGNLQAIQNAQMQLQALSEAMNHDSERRLLLERQLADIEAADSVTIPTPAPPAGTDPATAGSSAEQLDAAVALRRTLLVRFKPDHPDVVMLDRRIQALERKVQAERSTVRATPDVAARPVSASEIVKENRIRDIKANLQAVDRELAAKEASQLNLEHVNER